MEDLKQKAIKRVEEVVAKLNKIYKREMTVPEIVFEDIGSRTAGTANAKKHRVTFHPEYMKKAEFWDTKGAAVIEHEVSHLFTSLVFPNHKQAHGPEFRTIMSALHANGSTRHTMGTVETTKRTRVVQTFRYICMCRNDIQVSSIRHNRIQTGTKYYCKQCKQPIKPHQ